MCSEGIIGASSSRNMELNCVEFIVIQLSFYLANDVLYIVRTLYSPHTVERATTGAHVLAQLGVRLCT